MQNLRVLRKHGMERKVEWGQWAINTGFEGAQTRSSISTPSNTCIAGLEAVLLGTAGKYCVGDTITMADLCLVPQVYNARRFKVDMSKYPTIERIDAALLQLPAFKAAHPSAQPDCPEELR